MSDSDSDQAGVPLIEGLHSASPEPSKSSAKRKRAADEDADGQQPEAKTESKRSKKKRKKTKAPKDVDDEALDTELGVNHAIAHMDPSLMADHIAQRTKRFQPDLSLVEAEDLRILERAIMDTTAFEKDRVAENLPEFLEQFATSRQPQKKGKKGGKKGSAAGLDTAPSEKGAPHTLVIAASGIRAADLTRALRQFQTKECMVAKLFAKHIKLQEQIELCKKCRMGIGVGTPQRVLDLLDQGALKLEFLERVVVDASHVDQKKRGILDMKEVQAPLVKLLARMKERYEGGAAEDGEGGKGKVELIFY
jgi:protein CMS1